MEADKVILYPIGPIFSRISNDPQNLVDNL